MGRVDRWREETGTWGVLSWIAACTASEIGTLGLLAGERFGSFGEGMDT